MQRTIPAVTRRANAFRNLFGERLAEETNASIGLLQFLGITVQLGLLLYVINRFHLEELHGFPHLLPVIFTGFIIHSWLPLRWRAAFFFLLTLTAIGILLGPLNGLCLVGIGLGLIALCHLPIHYWLRVGLIVGAAGALVLVRLEWLATPWAPLVMPILGSMFMFRLMLYLYELRHEKKPVSLWQRLSYFFMLPNVCFPLFPIVDYTAFQRNYYDEKAHRIYQKGLRWMLRGIIHLFIYRIVYYYLIPGPTDVTDLNGLLLFMMYSYLLYIRISGLFHLIVGILCLFGYNLPPTHHLYFLATGYSDLWRRINIYWKDFVMRVFYYPVFFRFRKLGINRAITIAIIWTFFVNWMLHSYQWFWIRGTYPVTLRDGIFWGVFGLLVLVNSLLQARRSPQRSVGAQGWSPVHAAQRSLKTVGMFLTMCVLWSFINSPSIADWLTLMSAAARFEWIDVARIVLLAAAAVLVGIGIQYAQSRSWSVPRLRLPMQVRPVLLTSTSACCLFLVALPQADRLFDASIGEHVRLLQEERLNEHDARLMEQGYYETLMGRDNFTTDLWKYQLEKPRDWKRLGELDAYAQTAATEANPFFRVFRPNLDLTFKRAPFHTNSWGFRDREYTLEKPPGTFRVAVLGGSYTLGGGVDNDATFEALVEDRLNREFAGKTYARYELLNFAKSGNVSLHHVFTIQEQVLAFNPDAVLIVAHYRDENKAVEELSSKLDEVKARRYPFPEELERLIERADVRTGASRTDLEKRLFPLSGELADWSYRRIADLCREAGIQLVWVYAPLTKENSQRVAPYVDQLKETVRSHGITLLSMAGVFDGYDEKGLYLAPWDGHLNARGHRLVADRLYDELVANEEKLNWGLIK